MFPGESQQGHGEGGLFNLPSFKSGDQTEAPNNAAAPGIKAEHQSPFSGISQFDLFLGDAPAAQPADVPAGAAATTAAAAGAFAAAPADVGAPFLPAPGAETEAQGGTQLQSEFSQGLLGLLESADFQDLPEPLPQQQQEQQQVAAPQAQQQQQQQIAAPQAALKHTQNVSPFGTILPQQLQQPMGLGSSQFSAPAAAGASMPLPPTPPQQLVPPPLPQLSTQQQAAVQPLQQSQMQLPPLVSPLLLQQQQQQHGFQTVNLGAANIPLLLPQFGQQQLGLYAPPAMQPSQQSLQQQLQFQAGQPPLQQQWHTQLQQHQKQPVAMQFGADGYDDDDSDGDGHPRNQSGHPKRRGRPPKVPGQYSKGYEAIKRYREKKKGMVGGAAD